MSCSIIFVIDPPGLIAEAAPLVFSVRKHMPNTDLIAYCPAEKINQIPTVIKDILTRARVDVRSFDVAGQFEPPYRQGNKLLAVAAPRETEFTLFLDTDVVVWQPFSLSDIAVANTLCAAPEGMRSWPVDPDEGWDSVYSHFDLSVPERRVRLVKTRGLSAPYFNGGVVAFPNQVPTGDLTFGQLWLETARELERSGTLKTPRPWLDQVSLPVAAVRAGLDWVALDLAWNLSLSRPFGGKTELTPEKSDRAARAIKRVDTVDPYLLHYHKPRFFRDTKYQGYLDRLMAENTGFKTYRAFVHLLKSERA